MLLLGGVCGKRLGIPNNDDRNGNGEQKNAGEINQITVRLKADCRY